LSRILPPALMAELRELGSVEVAPSPDDLTAEDTRRLLARAEVLVTGWGSDLVDVDVLAAASCGGSHGWIGAAGGQP
jgi:hypothetical protein